MEAGRKFPSILAKHTQIFRKVSGSFHEYSMKIETCKNTGFDLHGIFTEASGKFPDASGKLPEDLRFLPKLLETFFQLPHTFFQLPGTKRYPSMVGKEVPWASPSKEARAVEELGRPVGYC